MATKKKPLIIVASLATAAIVLTLLSSGAINIISSFQAIPSTGSITAVQNGGGGGGGGGSGGDTFVAAIGIYLDSDCTQNLTTVNWGAMSPGDETTQLAYIKNLGNASVTLSLTPTNWAPSEAASSLDLSWNIDSSHVLAPGETIQAMITLAIAQDIDPSITSYSFDIQVVYTTVEA